MNAATGNLVIQRFLALFLFAGCLVFGLAIPAAIDGAFKGPSQTIGMLFAAVLTAWMLGWLGMVLWSGRGIPRWFIRGFLLVLIGGQVVCACCCNSWSDAGVIVSSLVISAAGFPTIWRDYGAKPAKPPALDEF